MTLLSDGDQGGPLPSPLEPGIEQSMDHNSLVANCAGRINLLAWCESLPVYLVYLCHPTKCGPVTFLASLGGLYTVASFIPRRESWIWLTVGAVMESQPFLKLQSLVVLGGKWLPFSLVGGIPMFVKEPHWWHINGFPHSMIRRWPCQIK